MVGICWNTTLLGWPIFRGHVSFREGNGHLTVAIPFFCHWFYGVGWLPEALRSHSEHQKQGWLLWMWIWIADRNFKKPNWWNLLIKEYIAIYIFDSNLMWESIHSGQIIQVWSFCWHHKFHDKTLPETNSYIAPARKFTPKRKQKNNRLPNHPFSGALILWLLVSKRGLIPSERENISPTSRHFWVNDFPNFPWKVGDVSSFPGGFFFIHGFLQFQLHQDSGGWFPTSVSHHLNSVPPKLREIFSWLSWNFKGTESRNYLFVNMFFFGGYQEIYGFFKVMDINKKGTPKPPNSPVNWNVMIFSSCFGEISKVIRATRHVTSPILCQQRKQNPWLTFHYTDWFIHGLLQSPI